MQCPTDGTVLVMSERSGIEIDYCPTCRGVWLDRGELDKIIERSEQAPPAAARPDPYEQERDQRRADQRPALRPARPLRGARSDPSARRAGSASCSTEPRSDGQVGRDGPRRRAEPCPRRPRRRPR